MKRIPYVDLAAHHAGLEEELIEATRSVIRSGWYILGPEVAAFEQQMAERLGCGAVVGVNSGTDALILALRRAGVGPGDEVITVSHTFAATASAIQLVGAKPVLIDIVDDTMLLDPTLLEGARTHKTAAVLPVHLGGMACDMTAIAAFCAQHSLALIEDCAQSIGAQHAGRCIGTFGYGAFSLHPLKVLSAIGDGGFITSSSEEEPLRQARNLGLTSRGHVGALAGNSRLDTLQAAMLLVKLRHLDAWIDARRAHAAAYRAALSDHLWCMRPEPANDYAVYSTFVVRHPERDALIKALDVRGVDAKVHYPFGVHQQEAFADVAHTGLAITERVVQEIVSLPVTPELAVDDRNRVIDAVLDAVKEVVRAGT